MRRCGVQVEIVPKMDCNSCLCAFAPLREIFLVCRRVVIVAVALRQSAMAEEPAAGPPVPDPAKIVGSDQCAKCHQPEVQQWMRTPHFATFDSLHRKPRAKEIADKLGLQSIKRNDVCTQCHYTQQNQDGRERVVAGVSCESCHGGGAGLARRLHADYGGAGMRRRRRSRPSIAAQRVKDSIAPGMNNPHNIYLIARQCYDCHTVPNEKLVNVGGHMAGSQDFELVAWSQGMVRHNFVRTGGTANATLSPEELRVMYVVGVLTDLEYSLRAVAAATEKATFGVTSAQRAARMKKRLHEIQTAGQRSAAAAGAGCRGDGRTAAGQQGGDHGGGRRGRQSGVRVRGTSRRQATGGDRSAAAAAEAIQELDCVD